MKNIIKYSSLICLLLISIEGLNAQIIPDGTYQIYSDVHQEAMVTATSGDFDISMATPNFSDNNQLWSFTHQGGNVYKISNIATGSFIGIKDGWCGRFGDVQARYLSSDANVEFLISAGNNTGSYVFQIAFTTCNFGSVNSPVRAFDIQDGNSGAQIQTFDVDLGGANQQFRLISHEWTGSTDTSWAESGNWSPSVPTSTSNVRIPNVTNKPIISASASVKDILINNSSSLQLNSDLTIAGDFSNMGTTTISAGNSLLVSGNSSGNITYNVNVSDTNWHLIASPVVGQNYDDTWIVDNDIASGSDFTTNRGIATYDNTSSTSPNIAGEGGHWRYFQGGATAVTFGTGVGYALIKDINPGVSNGDFSFTGTIPTTVNPTITQGTSTHWNLIGNSFPSYMDIAQFITTNNSNLPAAFKAIYVWNASTDSYDDLTSGHLQPGQAFFINSNIASGNASITKAMQSHQTGVQFYKNSLPSITLSISSGKLKRNTEIKFLDNATRGLDTGIDIGLFNGVSSTFSIHTNLVKDDTGIAFKRQGLPLNEISSSIIPLGIKNSVSSSNINFTIDYSNLPEGINIYLEDKQLGHFIKLENNNSHVIKTNTPISGIGRFYLHISNSTLTTENFSLDNVKVFFSKANTIRVVGISSGNVQMKVFSSLGKEIINTIFNSSELNEVQIPDLSTGVYIVQIENKFGKLNKRIIIK